MYFTTASTLQLVAIQNQSPVSRKTLRADWSYFLLDFCGRPRNGSLYRRLQAYSLPSEHTEGRPLFRHEHGYRVRPRISLSFCGVPRSVLGCTIDFLPLRSLSLARRRARLESAWRKRIRGAARRGIRLNYGPGSFVYSGIHYPAGATGQLSGAICNLTPRPYSYFSFARFVIERVSSPAALARAHVVPNVVQL